MKFARLLCGKHFPNECYHCALDAYDTEFYLLFFDPIHFKGFAGYFPNRCPTHPTPLHQHLTGTHPNENQD